MSRASRSNLLNSLYNMSGKTGHLTVVDYVGLEKRLLSMIRSDGHARTIGKSVNFAFNYGTGYGKSNYAQMAGRMVRDHLTPTVDNVSVSLESGWMKLVVTAADVGVKYGPKEGRRTFCSGSFKMSFQDALLFARSLLPQDASAVFLDSRTGCSEKKMRPAGAKGKWIVRVRMTDEGGDWTVVRGDPRKLAAFAIKLESAVSSRIVADVMAT